MYDFSIGVVLDCFPMDTRDALKQAAALGLDGIQVYAIEGPISPEMTPAARREFRDLVSSHGLTISALCGDLGHGFFDPARNPGNIERSKRILDLAKDLGVDIVTTHIGVVPADPAHPRYAIMQDACGQLAEYADQLGLAFQIRDDILDVTGDAKELGKNIGVDAQNARCTYVSILGVEKAQALVDEHTEKALHALDAFDADSTFLHEFAEKLATRSK